MSSKQETYLILRWGSLREAHNIYIACKILKGNYTQSIEFQELDEYFGPMTPYEIKEKIGRDGFEEDDFRSGF